jgi:hypothetical protein
MDEESQMKQMVILGNFLEMANCNLLKLIKDLELAFGLFVKEYGGPQWSFIINFVQDFIFILKSVKLYFSSGALNSGEWT